MPTVARWSLWIPIGLALSACANDKAKHPLGGTCSAPSECAEGDCLGGLCLLPEGDGDSDALLNALEAQIGTSPVSRDTDGDGIDDATEVGDPQHPRDTDGDGRIDALESATADADHDCIPDQLDPHDDVPETDPHVLAAAICKVHGVCAAEGASVTASCASGTTPSCDYSGVPGYAATETGCNGKDDDCDGTTDPGCPPPCDPGTHRTEAGCVPDVVCAEDSCSGGGTCSVVDDHLSCACDAAHAGATCADCAQGYHRNGAGACVADATCATAAACPANTHCVEAAKETSCVCDGGALSGTLTVAAGKRLPKGPVKVGVFGYDILAKGEIDWAHPLYATGGGDLADGPVAFSVCTAAVAPEADFRTSENVAGLEFATFIVGAWVDADGDGGFTQGEEVVAAGETLIADLRGTLPENLAPLGAKLGWNLMQLDLDGQGGPKGFVPLSAAPTAYALPANLLLHEAAARSGSVNFAHEGTLRVGLVNFLAGSDKPGITMTSAAIDLSQAGATFSLPLSDPPGEVLTAPPQAGPGVLVATYVAAVWVETTGNQAFDQASDQTVGFASGVATRPVLVAYLVPTDFNAFRFVHVVGAGWQLITASPESGPHAVPWDSELMIEAPRLDPCANGPCGSGTCFVTNDTYTCLCPSEAPFDGKTCVARGGPVTVSSTEITGRVGKGLIVSDGEHRGRLCVYIDTDPFVLSPAKLMSYDVTDNPCAAATATTDFPGGSATLTAAVLVPDTTEPLATVSATIDVTTDGASWVIDGFALSLPQ